MGVITAIHLYVTDIDRSVDFYTRLFGYGPKAAYDERGGQSTFFVLDGQTFLVLTWDEERGKETGGVRLELAVEDVGREIERIRARGVWEGVPKQTRFGTEVYDVTDPDGHHVRIGPSWTLHAIEGAV